MGGFYNLVEGNEVIIFIIIGIIFLISIITALLSDSIKEKIGDIFGMIMVVVLLYFGGSFIVSLFDTNDTSNKVVWVGEYSNGKTFGTFNSKFECVDEANYATNYTCIGR